MYYYTPISKGYILCCRGREIATVGDLPRGKSLVLSEEEHLRLQHPTYPRVLTPEDPEYFETPPGIVDRIVGKQEVLKFITKTHALDGKITKGQMDKCAAIEIFAAESEHLIIMYAADNCPLVGVNVDTIPTKWW